MARQVKSKRKPEQGYAHRDHRSKKGRKKGAMYSKDIKRMLLKKEEKWIKKRRAWWGVV